ncbi:unnamed protein product [Albugo candida]|uniref:Uncharacterized protein n=1 Tax=Albugo candida TaxID=65357 RepID=A0A024G919_9STRA|nr:unnamed protein product [Albugo candida]|eukprot:CCI43035.1 unnamed protein product [Albugo candida]
MESFKERFVESWTSFHLHPGNIYTSRLEGNDSASKRWLHFSTVDVQQVHSRTTQYVEHQESSENG